MRGLTIVLAAIALAHSDGVAQSSELARVDSLTAVGRVHDAREALQSWWDESWSGADRTDAQWALWLRGRLTVDPDMAALDYRRLIIEHPAGPYSADAHLRLGQSAMVRGDTARAADHFRAVVRDYPSSPARALAARTLDRLGPVAQSATPLRGKYAIQLGAFFNDEGAREMYARAAGAGLNARTVRVGGDDLRRVRVGWFGTREAAEVSAEAVRRLGFDATIVSDGDREAGG